jgi:hypothetical protein
VSTRRFVSAREVAPSLHQWPSVLNEVGSSISGPNLVWVCVRQRSFAHFVANSAFGSPDLKGSARSMSGRTFAKTHVTQGLREDHV